MRSTLYIVCPRGTVKDISIAKSDGSKERCKLCSLRYVCSALDSVTCQECPHGFNTLTAGATSLEACGEFDKECVLLSV